MEALVDVIAMGLQAAAISVAPEFGKGKGIDKPVESSDKRKSWADLAEEQETLDAVEMVNEVIAGMGVPEAPIGDPVVIVEQSIELKDA